MKRSTAQTGTAGSPSSDEFAMRELEDFFRAEDPVRLAAATWHTRQEQGLSVAEDAQFRQWLAASPAHQAALTRIEASLGFVGTLSNAQMQGLRQTPHMHSPNPETPPVHAVDRTSGVARQRIKGWLAALSASRTASMALCCAALLVIGIGWMQWLKQPTFAQSFTVQRGERLDIPLPDGTQLALDADTQLDVALFRHRREVRLVRGQVMFSVAHDTTKPFIVLAGPAEVTVVGTRFSVRYKTTDAGASDVDVAVEEGHVRVDSKVTDVSSARASVDLLAGQAVHASSAGVLSQVAAIDPASIAPWRKGLIHFSSTPLAEAIQEFERYGPSHLIVRDPAVAALAVGGSYLTGSPNAFANVLPRILPVKLISHNDGNVEIVMKNQAH